MLGIRVSCQAESKYWLSFNSKTIRQVIIVGDPNLDKKWRLKDGRILYLRCRDGWEHLPEKMIAAYSAVVQIPEFREHTHFLKLDRDNTITPRFRAHRSPLIKSLDYAGPVIHTPHRTLAGVYHLGRVPETCPWYNKRYRQFRGQPTYKFPFHLGGNSYILSRKAINILRSYYTFENLHLVEQEHIYEDLMVGMLLKMNGIPPRKISYGIYNRGSYAPNQKRANTYLRNNPHIWRT